MGRNQRDHSVATEPKPVYPEGQPISASTNRGLKVRRASQISPPARGIVRTWRPSNPFTGVFASELAPSLWSRAVGVIQSCIASQRVTPSWCLLAALVLPLVRFRVPLLSPAPSASASRRRGSALGFQSR